VASNAEGVGVAIVFGNGFETVGGEADQSWEMADGDAEKLGEGILAIADDDEIFDGVGIVGAVDFAVEIEDEKAVLVQLGHAHPFVAAFENAAGRADDFDEDVEGNGEVEVLDFDQERFDLGNGRGGGAEVEFGVEKHGRNEE
jgi:hypothetical protein